MPWQAGTDLYRQKASCLAAVAALALTLNLSLGQPAPAGCPKHAGDKFLIPPPPPTRLLNIAPHPAQFPYTMAYANYQPRIGSMSLNPDKLIPELIARDHGASGVFLPICQMAPAQAFGKAMNLLPGLNFARQAGFGCPRRLSNLLPGGSSCHEITALMKALPGNTWAGSYWTGDPSGTYSYPPSSLPSNPPITGSFHLHHHKAKAYHGNGFRHRKHIIALR